MKNKSEDYALMPQETLIKFPKYPLPIVLRLLVVIIVKQHLLIPAEDLQRIFENNNTNPAVIKIVEKLFELNKKLLDPKITGEVYDYLLKVNALPWHHGRFLTILKEYSAYLLSLGFTLEEQVELLPSGTPIPRILSLRDLAILEVKKLSKLTAFKEIKKRDRFHKDLSLLSRELNASLHDNDYLLHVARQQYINGKDNWGGGYLSYVRRQNLDIKSEPKKEVSTSFLKRSRPFFANNHIDAIPAEITPCVIRLISFLLRIINIPENDLLKHFDESTGHNIAQIAAAYASSTIFDRIMKLAGFDVTLKDKKKSNLLHITLSHINSDVFSYLINRYKDANPIIDLPDDHEQTPLHIAVALRDLYWVKMLVNSGADLNQQDLNGDSPLHIDAECYATPVSSDSGLDEGCFAIAEFLLRHGARIEVLNKRNPPLTPYESCLQKPFKVAETISFFEHHYKKIRNNQGYIYRNILMHENRIDFLRAALSKGRGVVLLEEFLNFDLQSIRNYRNNGQTVIHIIHRAMISRPGESRIVGITALELIAKKLPELFWIKDLQGRTGFDLVGELDLVDVIDKLFKDGFFYENMSPLRRGENFSFLFLYAILSLSLLITLWGLGSVMDSETYTLFTSLTLFAIGLSLRIIIPPHFIPKFEAIMERLSLAPIKLLGVICSNDSVELEEPVRPSVVESSNSIENANIYSSPVGLYTRIRHRVISNNVASTSDQPNQNTSNFSPV